MNSEPCAISVTHNRKPLFSGISLSPQLLARSTGENHAYTVLSAWYGLTRIFYQQEWTVRDCPFGIAAATAAQHRAEALAKADASAVPYGVRRLVGALPFILHSSFFLLPSPPLHVPLTMNPEP